MLALIRRLVEEVTGKEPPSAFPPGDERLAAAALLTHVATVDGRFSDGERERIAELLRHRFDLGVADTDALMRAAATAEDEAVDLYAFTSVLKRRLDEDGRRRIVEMLWEIVYADGKVTEFEDNVVWRVAELIGVSARERVLLKKEAAGRAGAAEEEAP